jgi:hypothetical protein
VNSHASGRINPHRSRLFFSFTAQDAPEARQAPDDCGDPDDKDQVGSEVY